MEERTTEAMEYGRELHKESYILPITAIVKPFKIVRGPMLVSNSLRLSGRPDYILITRLGEHVPVEVKWAEEPGKSRAAKRDHRLQMAAYALLIEEHYGATVKRGYIYYIRSGRIAKVHIDSSLKREVKDIIRRIYDIIEGEAEPKVKVGRAKCKNCGWRVYCGEKR